MRPGFGAVFVGVLAVFVAGVVVWPAFAVPLVASGWFVAGFVADDRHDTHEVHRARARRIAVVHFVAVAVGWMATTALPWGLQSAAVAMTLGGGLGLAAGGLSLIGMDARRHVRGQP